MTARILTKSLAGPIADAPLHGAASRFRKGDKQIVTPELLALLPRPLLFRGLVWLKEPMVYSQGGIALEKTAASQAHTTHHGLLVKVGKLFYKARTPGLDYADEDPPKVGDWVMFLEHSGRKRAVKIDPSGPRDDPANILWVVTISDTDITDSGTEEVISDRLVGWL